MTDIFGLHSSGQSGWACHYLSGGASPLNAIENEPAPRLIADPPLPEQLARGVVEIQYRVENLHIVPVFGGVPSTYLHGSGICT